MKAQLWLDALRLWGLGDRPMGSLRRAVREATAEELNRILRYVVRTNPALMAELGLDG